MKTTNVISTPEITGNIGTCETKSVEALIHGGFWKKSTQVIMTNSCTGEIVKDYQYESYNMTIFFAFSFALFLIWTIVGIIQTPTTTYGSF